MSRVNPYRSPEASPPALPREPARRPTSFYRLWLGLAMLISLAQLRFRGVYDAMEIDLPRITQWAMRPTLPLVVFAVGVVLAQVSRRLRSDHHPWLSWASLVMVATVCLGYAVSLYLPLITVQASLD